MSDPMPERCVAFFVKPPELDWAQTTEFFRMYFDGMADDRWGEGNWRRVELKVELFEDFISPADRHHFLRGLCTVGPPEERTFFDPGPDAEIYRGKASYVPLEVGDD